MELSGAKALFLTADGNVYPDSQICSGVVPVHLNGRPCPFSENGHFPTPIALTTREHYYNSERGNPGDLCPPCAKQRLPHPSQWQGQHERLYPSELLQLRLFKCYQWLNFVVPGLYETEPTQLRQE